MRKGWISRSFIAFTVLLLITTSLSCLSQKRSPELIQYQLRQIIIPTNFYAFEVKFPLRYYIVNKNTDYSSIGFTDDELVLLNRATEDWNNKTNGIVKIELISNWNATSAFDPYIYKDLKTRTVWKVNYEHYIIQELYKIYDPFCGLSWGNLIIVVDSPRCNYLQSTFTHELGHQFGLLHIKNKYPAVMNPKVNSAFEGKQITQFDILQFCILYGCIGQEWYKTQTY